MTKTFGCKVTTRIIMIKSFKYTIGQLEMKSYFPLKVQCLSCLEEPRQLPMAVMLYAAISFKIHSLD